MLPCGGLLHLHLPDGPAGSLTRLCEGLPGSRRTPTGLRIPLADHTPEEILALCLRLGVTARATTITPGGASVNFRR
jgi:hypothetical protein